MKKFVLMGAAGYIAPRHFNAIKSIGSNLVAINDLRDSVGAIDNYFSECLYFKKIDKFGKFIKNYNKSKSKIEYLSICTPNYLHKEHIIFGLQNGLNVICEKPLVLNFSDLKEIKYYEKKHNRKVYTILQLRLMPEMIEFKKLMNLKKNKKKYKIKLDYISTRGDWFFKSWKGKINLSGGVATNIGVHFFDLLIWLFGKVKNYEVLEYNKFSTMGKLNLKYAEVEWFVSVNKEDLPQKYILNNKSTYRSLKVENKEIEFSKNFNNLHNLSYENIIKGRGFRIADAENSIKLCNNIRNQILIK